VIQVGRASDLFCGEFQVDHVNWVSIHPPDDPIRGQVRIRNQHVPAPARIIPRGQDRVLVRFDQPQRAVTPGQAAVFYDGEVVLGGGMIMRRESSITEGNTL
ncbi:MAG: tRNA 2-thiouridine(34) synthase MnmA, partial [Syntrophobacteraceae bacterium]|nr:tRNA 2-thiouridine(34) synthase MnmA [Syntrophobacteraceae bacterium]